MEKKTRTIAKMLKATKREAPKKDFEYVVQRPGKSRLCFGTAQERNAIKAVSRFEIEYECHISPGISDEPLNPATNKPISKLGTVLGGRTAPRDLSVHASDEIPCPGTYSPKDIFEVPSFTLTRAPRLKAPPKHINTTVGPGYYKPSHVSRTMKFAYSFGGSRRLIPAIETKCVPVNLDCCEKCKQQPIGDYWQFADRCGQLKTFGPNGDQDEWFLCRHCYEIERKVPQLFSRQIIQQFKKVRDCSQIHYHGGCNARILLLPPREIANMKANEAYLELYFP